MKRLIIRPGAIGDFILSIPAMECLRCEYLEVWAASQNLPLARFADRSRAIASTGLDLLGIVEPDPRLIDTLRGFDSIVSWYGANRPDFRELVAGLKLPFQFFTALPQADEGIHAADFFLRQVRTLANCSPASVPRIACPAGKEDFAVIHPFSGSRKKCWPLERFQELAQKLAKRMPVNWCAGPEDDLSGATRFDDLYELACWLAQARIYIGNDSGPAHLAAAVGTPVVALFGASDPAMWAPRGPHVTILAGSSMQSITVQQVERFVSLTLGAVQSMPKS